MLAQAGDRSIAQVAKDLNLCRPPADRFGQAAGQHLAAGVDPKQGLHARHRVAQSLHLRAEYAGRLSCRPTLGFFAQKAQRRVGPFEIARQVELDGTRLPA